MATDQHVIDWFLADEVSTTGIPPESEHWGIAKGVEHMAIYARHDDGVDSTGVASRRYGSNEIVVDLSTLVPAQNFRTRRERLTRTAANKGFRVIPSMNSIE